MKIGRNRSNEEFYFDQHEISYSNSGSSDNYFIHPVAVFNQNIQVRNRMKFLKVIQGVPQKMLPCFGGL